MTLRTLVIDDEPIALEKLRAYVEKTPWLELVAACESSLEGIEIISRGDVDLVFTDISMPDLDGIEMVKSLTNPPMVVFITAYDNYAVESYRLAALDYLLKPYSFADFQRAAAKARGLMELRANSTGASPGETIDIDAPEDIATSNADSLFVKTDYRYLRVDFKNIRYIKGYGEYLQIYLDNQPTPILTLSSFAAILKKLPENFLQVHRSYIVNMNMATQIERARIVMDADTFVPVGDSYKPMFQQYLSRHSVGGK